jgi:hypothetical protein
VSATSEKKSEYLDLAKEVCKIVEIPLEPNESLDSILIKIKRASQTPYMSSTQKEIREILVEIAKLIEEQKDIKDIKSKIEKLESDVLWDKYWE